MSDVYPNVFTNYSGICDPQREILVSVSSIVPAAIRVSRIGYDDRIAPLRALS